MKKTDYIQAPVITILGHVDHGKTSLLDYIRKSHLVAGEAGGITQHTAAYQITHQRYPLTFIDTPGHAAFQAMRHRGSSMADIAILIIAADDGVMPQSKESLGYIKDLKLPFVVAINKTDLPGIDINKTKTQLAEEQVYVEGFGGNTPVVEISAKTGKNIDSLLETIVLLAQLENLKDRRSAPPQAIVLEANLDSRKGAIATLLVKQGIFNKADQIYLGQNKIGKIRAMFGFNGLSIHKATPATPFEALGLSQVPQVGQILTTLPSQNKPQPAFNPFPARAKQDSLFNIIVKTDVVGTLEAVLTNLPPGYNPVSTGTGSISETDIETALRNQAEIISFNIKTPSPIVKLAKDEGVKILSFNIIYKLLEYLQQKIDQKQAKDKQQQPTATLKVLKVFNINNHKILGCKVTDGVIGKQDLLGTAKILSLKQGKTNINQAESGQELGIITSPALDASEGDTLQSFSGKL